ncbi:hypothetical protein [Thioclava pacifica]|uniref:Uncharacterized protein n=1 Tax=Thioclava pacifica DSM 10166 TaxID=1353537 RepID=A0A074J2L5_9RHOB|nr:hypothetical protein [Thioclava pacifica]KEO51621.1 hypothetical protein TP2_12045 [Thioclava pacifica DSM 10166]
MARHGIGKISRRAAFAGAALLALVACVPEPPRGGGHPSKLDGAWLGTYTPFPSIAQMYRACTKGYGGMRIANGRLSGEATNRYGASYSIAGRVVGKDRIEGNFFYRGRKVGSLKGHLEKGRIVGNYDSIGGCKGTWVARRR